MTTVIAAVPRFTSAAHDIGSTVARDKAEPGRVVDEARDTNDAPTRDTAAPSARGAATRVFAAAVGLRGAAARLRQIFPIFVIAVHTAIPMNRKK